MRAIRRPFLRSSTCVYAPTRSAYARRTFFASSTDHTRLLSESQVFRLEKDGHMLYVLAAGGSDEETVQKVPQLHLARLCADSTSMWGAKVVNRTLGNHQEVCGKLVDAVLEDMTRPILAKSTLHGLSDWVVDTICAIEKGEAKSPAIQSILDNETAIKEAMAVAQNKSDPGESWALLAKEFALVDQGEPALYQSKGASLVEIQHKTDTTEFSNTCAGSMAILQFK